LAYAALFSKSSFIFRGISLVSNFIHKASAIRHVIVAHKTSWNQKDHYVGSSKIKAIITIRMKIIVTVKSKHFDAFSTINDYDKTTSGTFNHYATTVA